MYKVVMKSDSEAFKLVSESSPAFLLDLEDNVYSFNFNVDYVYSTDLKRVSEAVEFVVRKFWEAYVENNVYTHNFQQKARKFIRNCLAEYYKEANAPIIVKTHQERVLVDLINSLYWIIKSKGELKEIDVNLGELIALE